MRKVGLKDMSEVFCYVGQANHVITRKALRLMQGGKAIAIIKDSEIKRYDVSGSDVLLINMGDTEERITDIISVLYEDGANFVYEITPSIAHKLMKQQHG